MTIDVAAALIQDERGRYLITRRLAGTHLAGLWEFPGGKREAGESLEQCLRRELAEELGGDFAIGERLETITWTYPDKIVTLHFYRCRLVSGAIEPRQCADLAWVEPSRLGEYEFPAADQALIARLTTR